MIDFSNIEPYFGPLQVEDLDAAVAMALNPDSTPDATHTSNLITSAAVAGVQSDIASINITGTTNDTGATLRLGEFFYLNGTLCRVISEIADGATLTENTNYEVVTAGGLNELRVDVRAVGANSSITLNVPYLSAALIATARSNTSQSSLSFVTATEVSPIVSSAYITLSLSSNTLTISNSTGYAVNVHVLNFSPIRKVTFN